MERRKPGTHVAKVAAAPFKVAAIGPLARVLPEMNRKSRILYEVAPAVVAWRECSVEIRSVGVSRAAGATHIRTVLNPCGCGRDGRGRSFL